MTSLSECGNGVLKTDQLGRVLTSAERRRKILEEYDRSGLSAPQFAALIGTKYQTFAGWLHLRRKENGTTVSRPRKDQVKWLEAVVAELPGSSACDPGVFKVHMPGGAWVEVSQAQQLPLVAALLRAIENGERAC